MRRFGVLLLITLALPLYIHAAGEVDLLWQGETYTPPFYEGLPLWSKQSRVRFTAISNLPNSASLYYRWTKNGTVLGTLSGVNKPTITFVDSALSLPLEVKVDLRNGEDGDILGSTTIVLNPISMKLLVVEDNPLYGLLLNKAVSSLFVLSQDEVTFSALPLFGKVTQRNAPAFSYSWIANSGDSRSGNTVTYRSPESGAGTALITLEASNAQILDQPAEKSFSIKFDKQNAF